MLVTWEIKIVAKDNAVGGQDAADKVWLSMSWGIWSGY